MCCVCDGNGDTGMGSANFGWGSVRAAIRLQPPPPPSSSSSSSSSNQRIRANDDEGGDGANITVKDDDDGERGEVEDEQDSSSTTTASSIRQRNFGVVAGWVLQSGLLSPSDAQVVRRVFNE